MTSPMMPGNSTVTTHWTPFRPRSSASRYARAAMTMIRTMATDALRKGGFHLQDIQGADGIGNATHSICTYLSGD